MQGIIEVSVHISKASLGGQVMCGSVQVPVGTFLEGNACSCESEAKSCNGDTTKLKMPGMCNVCSRKVQTECLREVMCTTDGKTLEEGCLSHSELIFCQQEPDAGCRATEFDVYPPTF
jgi:hypothetical protein